MESGVRWQETSRQLKLSGNQYRSESGETQARRRRQLWDARVAHLQQAVDLFSRKTGCASDLASHVSALAGVHGGLFQEKLRRARARARFHVWSGRTRVLDAFFGRVLDGREQPFVAWGDASFAPATRGSAATPTKSVLKRAQLYFGARYVALVDEHKTTAVCRECGGVMSSVCRRREPDMRVVEVRGLKLCRSTVCLSHPPHTAPRLVDRDVNASRNIMDVAVRRLRPPSLARGRRLDAARRVLIRRQARVKRDSRPKG